MVSARESTDKEDTITHRGVCPSSVSYLVPVDQTSMHKYRVLIYLQTQDGTYGIPLRKLTRAQLI